MSAMARVWAALMLAVAAPSPPAYAGDVRVVATSPVKLKPSAAALDGNPTEDRGGGFCTVEPVGGALPVTTRNLFALPIAVGSPVYGADATLFVDFEGTLK